MDSVHPLEPTDLPLLPLAAQQTPAQLDLEASRSRSRTHSEASERPTIAYPEQSHNPPRQIGQEESPVPEQPADPPQAASRSSSVAPTEFYSDIAKVKFILSLVTLRTLCSGIRWGNRDVVCQLQPEAEQGCSNGEGQTSAVALFANQGSAPVLMGFPDAA